MIVLVSLDADEGGRVHGRLQVERRVDPARQLFSTAPTVAEASGTSQIDVLRKLRALAESDAELSGLLAAWEAERARPKT